METTIQLFTINDLKKKIMIMSFIAIIYFINCIDMKSAYSETQGYKAGNYFFGFSANFNQGLFMQEDKSDFETGSLIIETNLIVTIDSTQVDDGNEEESNTFSFFSSEDFTSSGLETDSEIELESWMLEPGSWLQKDEKIKSLQFGYKELLHSSHSSVDFLSSGQISLYSLMSWVL